MGEIIISKKTNPVFGNMVHITNGIVELEASIDFGPRILRYNLAGMENMFYNDLNMKPINDNEFPEFGGGILKVYGGHRLWVSPEIMPRCYYPDNFPVAVQETKTGIILEAPAEKYNNIQKTIEIQLNEHNAEVQIINSIKNVGCWDIVFAPWALTVMDKGGVEVLPQACRQTGLLSNRFIGLWPYTDMSDPRVYWGKKYIVLRQDPSAETAFKIGTNNEHGWAAYFNKEQLFIKRYEHVTDGFYPDFAGCSYETYTDKNIIELETLGQIGVVEPGKTVAHAEKWTLYSESFIPERDENKIDEVMTKYI